MSIIPEYQDIEHSLLSPIKKRILQKNNVEMICLLMTELAKNSEDYFCDNGSNFNAKKLPEISIRSYLERIAKFANCSDSCFLAALIYIDRIGELYENFAITLRNIHRLLLSSIVVAAKFFDDNYYENKYYAKVGGVSLEEMNLMESEFLSLIQYNLHVLPNTYQQYLENLNEIYN